MRAYGHIDLNNNQVLQMAIKEETTFPNPPVSGRIAFKDKRVWICVEIDVGITAWVPLTGINSTFVFDQETPASTWTVTHNLGNATPLVQVYDNAGTMLIPNSVIPTSNNALTISFSTSIAGRAVVMFGDATVYPVA